jgi:hypothetical protein
MAITLAAATFAAQNTQKHSYEFKLLLGKDSIQLADITVYGDTSWAYSVDDGTVSGTLYFGKLPPPDVTKEKVAVIDSTNDGGVTGMRGVFKKFPAGGTLVIWKDGHYSTGVKFTVPVPSE